MIKSDNTSSFWYSPCHLICYTSLKQNGEVFLIVTQIAFNHKKMMIVDVDIDGHERLLTADWNVIWYFYLTFSLLNATVHSLSL